MASILPHRPHSSSIGSSATAARQPSLASFPTARRTVSNTSAPRDFAHPPIHPSHASAQSAKSVPNSFHSSQQSVVPRKRRKVKPQYPPASEEKHVEYILVASFDIDRGSVMEQQYPSPIGGDEHMLAELMLPDQTHLRSQDWTIFFLHKDTSEEEQPTESGRGNGRKGKRKAMDPDQAVGGAHGEDGGAQHDEESDSEDDDDDDTDDGFQRPPLVYVLNLVNTKKDNTVARGAIVKAMAICTRHSFLHIYKPLLLLALEEYFKAPIPETLASLYDAVNAMDLSLLPRLSPYEKHILQSSDVKDLFIEKFEAMVQQRMANSKGEKQPASTPGLQGRPRYGLPRDTHEYESIVPYNNIPVPVKIPTAVSPETVGDFSLIKLIQTFSNPHASSPQPFTHQHPHLTTSGPLTHPIIVMLNALLTQKRIVFIGHNLPSSEVAEAVLAACALASGGLLHGFTRHAFPYTDLTKIDDLLKVPGFIAGVTNPAFALREEWWDLLCDLPTGRMRMSRKIEPAPPTEGVSFFQQTGPHSAAALLQQEQAKGALSSPAILPMSLITSAFPTSNSHAGPGDPTGDGAFMHSILTSIAERRGEGAIRAKFRLWVIKFTRLAAAFEEMVYGASALHHAPLQSPTTPSTSSPITPLSEASGPIYTDPAVMGHGYVWPSTEAKLRELAANATRIEGWMKTRTYYNFIQDLVSSSSLRPVSSLDLQHLHDKLSRLRLSPDAAASIYLALADSVHTYNQINQLLSVIINASSGLGSSGGGGLFYLALGLFHPKETVRERVAELLARIRIHEAGRHFWDRLGRFEKKAWERIELARRERDDAVVEPGGGLGNT